MMHSASAIEVKHFDTPEQAKETIADELRRDFAEWMTTNRDEVWRPYIELMRDGKEFVARVLMPGVDPDNLEIMIAADVLLIKGETAGHRTIMSTRKFPQPVDPLKVHAVMKDGYVSIKAEIARASNVHAFMPRAA